MPSEYQKVLTTTDFDGTADEGLVQFSGAPTEFHVPVIDSWGFHVEGTIGSWAADLVDADDTADGSVPVGSGSEDEYSISYGAGRKVWRDGDGNIPDFKFVTTGKNGDGTFWMHWHWERHSN